MFNSSIIKLTKAIVFTILRRIPINSWNGIKISSINLKEKNLGLHMENINKLTRQYIHYLH